MNTPTINPDKLALFATVRLDEGAHDEGGLDMCAMEAAAWLTDEEWTDQPSCVSPVIGAFMRSLNDHWDDTPRQQLKPYTIRAIGTAGDGQDKARSYLALDWLLRTYTPTWLDLAGMHDDAAALRNHRRIVDQVAAREICPIVVAIRCHAAGARASARAAAADAARAAAADAARAFAWAAAAAFAWAAAGDTAWAAAGDAAAAADWTAAADTDWAVDRDTLTPAVAALQASAFDLLDRMIDPAAVTRTRRYS